jgi:hypothetical protein
MAEALRHSLPNTATAHIITTAGRAVIPQKALGMELEAAVAGWCWHGDSLSHGGDLLVAATPMSRLTSARAAKASR